MKETQYDLIISVGQAPLDIDTVKIETVGKINEKYNTKYNYMNLKNKLSKKFRTIISDNAGIYLCHDIYFYGLKYIEDNKLSANMIFIHIPMLNNISNIENLANIFN